MIEVRYVHTGASLGDAALAACARLLSGDESDRAARFLAEADRRTYVAAHAMLRSCLSRHGATPPEAWTFTTGPHGRPEPHASHAPPGLRFSLSHTRGLAICAVTTGGIPLGVDVESAGRRAPLALAERCFSPEERAALEALPEPGRPERFLEHWTLKEAFLKALGVGLTYPMDRVHFAIDGDAAPRVTAPPELEPSPGAWRFERWRLEGGFLAALAVRSDGREEPVEVSRWEPPLRASPSPPPPPLPPAPPRAP